MEFLKLSIYIAANGYITLNQEDDDTAYPFHRAVQLTPDMVDLVCEELQRLKIYVLDDKTQDNERLD